MLKKNFLNYLVVFNVVLLLGLFGSGYAFAQEVTPDAPILDEVELGESGELQLTVKEMFQFVKEYLSNQNFWTGILIAIIAILIFVIVVLGRYFYKKNPKEVEVVFSIGDIVVKIIPSKADDGFWEFVKKLIRAIKDPTIDSIRQELNELNK